MKVSSFWSRGRDHFFTWLPVLMMAVFALGTWWLVRNAPRMPGTEVERPLRHEADYFMRDFSVRNFDATGRLQSEIFGVEGHHYPDTDTLEVQTPRMRSFDDQGRLTVATAKRALSKGDGSEVQLFGNATVVREEAAVKGGGTLPRLEFRGEYLHAFINDDRVSSDKPVELLRGNDRFTGDVFEYDNDTGVVNLQGRVKGVIHMKAAPR
ncbi:LPS export ABC transporter periplasmic protein LptC [Ottowia thiooxydans]|uniref:LPS export ABC transporter periplasmic protein LptC n=1 Tax=Ottowia thiooxydans TaxID=219182 RepID=UPI00040B5082|nr:LPS export ABC transporter periplasmic protein LptC [Ottowia thiooxydans]